MPTILSGPVRLPDGTIPAHGRIVFRRREARVASPLVVPGPIEALIGTDAQFSIQLQGEAGGTAYAVLVEYWSATSGRLVSVDLPDVVVDGTGTATLPQVSAVPVVTGGIYDLHQGDSARLPVTMLDANRRPANITDAAVSAWLERGGVRTPLTAVKVDAPAGIVEVNITAAVSAGLPLGFYTAVIRCAVGIQVRTVRGAVKVI